jgi:hypothetical protein
LTHISSSGGQTTADNSKIKYVKESKLTLTDIFLPQIPHEKGNRENEEYVLLSIDDDDVVL